MQTNTLVVFDLETSSAVPATTQILEIACVALDFTRLEVVEGSEFSILVKPEDEGTLDPGAMAANKLPLDELRKAPPAKVAWGRFVDHVKKYAAKSGTYHAPYPAGKNIKGFDLPIVDRYCKRFGPKNDKGEATLFNPKWVFDVEDDLLRWLGQSNLSDSLSMDALREVFGFPKAGGHRALVDTRQTAWLVAKFLNLYRHFAPHVPFEGAAKRAGW